MRRLQVLLLVGLLALPPLVSAQPEGFSLPHVSTRTVRLAPDAVEGIPLAFEGGNFTAGWAVVFNAEVDAGSGPVQVNLSQQGEVVESWTLQGVRGPQHLHGRFPEDAEANLTLHNRGPDRANVTFYYDMSCECVGKTIPVAVEDGRVVFRVHVQAGQRWRATFPEPPAHDLVVNLTRRTDQASRYPDDFEVLFTSREPILQGGRAYHTFEWTADETADFYFWIETVQIDASVVGSNATEGPTTLLTPSLEPVHEDPPPSTPIPGWVAAVGLVAAAGLLAWRRRS